MKTKIKKNSDNTMTITMTGVTRGKLLAMINSLDHYAKTSPVAEDVLQSLNDADATKIAMG